MTSVDLSALPSVAFAPQSAGETETAIITAYEAIAKATLQPGDPVRLFLESLAYVISVQNGLIDLAGKQNLLAYARGGHLDHLGITVALGSNCETRFGAVLGMGNTMTIWPEEITDLEQELSLNTGAVAHWQHILTIAPEEI